MEDEYRIVFYETTRGSCPIQTFLDSTNEKVKAKFIRVLDLLEEHGPQLKRPYADILRDGIYELRVRLSSDRYRAFYFFFDGREIVVTHGIVKKTEKVPPGEIDRAINYRRDYAARRQAQRRRLSEDGEELQKVERKGPKRPKGKKGTRGR